MGIDNLDRIFRPKSIAVVGASERKGSIGFAIMRNLINGGYTGDVIPVGSSHETLWKRSAYPSLLDVRSSIDLVILAAPIVSAARYVRECADIKAGGVLICPSAGKGTVDNGNALEEIIRKEVQGSDLRVIGPDCLGLFCRHSNLNATCAGGMPLPGKMAFISQSGAVCAAMLDLSIKEHIGFSYVVSLGSMIDVNFGDMIDYMGGDFQVGSIVMYVERLTHFRGFMSAARAVSRIKPIIALKAGRTKAGALAAASHTGALTGEDAFYDAAFKRAGIVRVNTFEELFSCAGLLAKQPRPSGPGLAIVTNAGGPGIIAADVLSDYGMEPVSFSAGVVEKLDSILPSHWSRGNPIDMLGEASAEMYRKVVEVCAESPEINAILIMFVPQATADSEDVARLLADFFKGKSYPVFTSWIGGPGVEKGREILKKAGIPTFDMPERAVRAFVNLFRYGKNIEMLQEIPPKLPVKLAFGHNEAQSLIRDELKAGNFLLPEIKAKALFSAYGIPVNPTETASTVEEAIQKAEKIGFPVAMKIDSPDITHKTEAGGVKLNLESEAEIRTAFRKIMESAWSFNPIARIEGVTIQSMFNQPGYELILGSRKDRDFGPMLLFGMGGGMTDIIRDRSIALPPLNRLLARRLMEETRIYHMFSGNGNHVPVQLEMLEEILMRMSQLATDFPEIEEMEINPLIVTRNDVCAVDARVFLKPTQVQAPLHLIISPYPNQYEAHTVSKEGEKLFLRPIRPEDAPLLVELFEHRFSQ